jgi:hypothetical protein
MSTVPNQHLGLGDSGGACLSPCAHDGHGGSQGMVYLGIASYRT